MASGLVSTGSPGCHSSELHSGVGDGRAGAGGGFDPRLGFCATEPDPPDPPDPPSLVPEPLDLPEPPPPAPDAFFVTRGDEVLDGDIVADAVAERLGAALGEAAPLDALTDADTESEGELSLSADPSPPPAAEQPTRHRPASTTTALETADPRGRTPDIAYAAALTRFIPLFRCSDVPNARNPPARTITRGQVLKDLPAGAQDIHTLPPPEVNVITRDHTTSAA
ncbi:hypothetical protein B6E66_02165 [Streptomyces maremycinicus]|nr:hypothetical protein B6E66_02165 [Streptomyces sp. B9173]